MAVDTIQRKPQLNQSLYYFDLLKILVVIFICCVHHEFYAQQLTASCGFFNYIRLNGHTLVYLMFMMSGVLYYFTYHKKIQNNETTFFNFISKKYIRFFFLAFITTTLTVLLYVIFDAGIGFVSDNPIDYLISITFYGRTIFGKEYINNAPLWFVNVLMFAYIFAYLASKAPKKYSMYIFAMLSVFGLAMSQSHGFPFFNDGIAEGFFPFFLGVLIGKLFEFFKEKKKLRTIIKVASLCLLVAYILLDFVFKIRAEKYYNFYTTFAFFAPILIILYDVPTLNNVFSHKVFRDAGKISFFMYVWNWPVVQILNLILVDPFISDRTAWWMLPITLAWHLAFGILTLIISGKIRKNIIEKKAQKEENYGA